MEYCLPSYRRDLSIHACNSGCFRVYNSGQGKSTSLRLEKLRPIILTLCRVNGILDSFQNQVNAWIHRKDRKSQTKITPHKIQALLLRYFPLAVPYSGRKDCRTSNVAHLEYINNYKSHAGRSYQITWICVILRVCLSEHNEFRG